jgi:hypothetical protein
MLDLGLEYKKKKGLDLDLEINNLLNLVLR